MQNTGASAVDELYVLSDAGSVMAGPLSLKAGESQTWRSTASVSAAQLAEGKLRYRVRYVLGRGQPGERAADKEVSITLRKLSAKPELEFTRELSANYIEYGDELTVTYRLKNAGNVKLTDILVSDSLFGGTVEHVESLGVGKKRTITRKVVVKKRLVSKAAATCSYEGGDDELRVSRGASTIYLADVKLDLMLDADKVTVASGDLVTLRLKLINNGNVPFSKLHVEDAVFGDLGWLAGALKPGESYTVTKAVEMKSTATFQFAVSGECATGAQLQAKSNELTVFAQPVASEIKLRIQAQADKTVLDAPGDVTFSLTVFNGGGIELRNVQLLEQTRGEIRSLLFVPDGTMPPLTQTYAVSESCTFRFIARTQDAAGEDITAISDPISVEVRSPEATPAVPAVAEQALPTPAPLLTRGRLVPALALASGLTVALTALLIVSYVRAFREKRGKRRDARKHR
jgi:uncharacterized repeat protein (TIGR01451 family)